jgi:Tfp pilus assembly protein PilF
VSLINKMLNDLEKRDAFLNENQDHVLDGLYSAYDLELTDKKKINIPFVISISLLSVILIFTLFVYSYEPNKFNQALNIKAIGSFKTVVAPDVSKDTEINNISTVEEKSSKINSISIVKDELGEISVNSDSLTTESGSPDKTELKENESNYYLKMDNNLLLKDDVYTSSDIRLNYIDSIKFEVDNAGINLLIKSQSDIDYLVYGLNNPDRTVIEVEHAELGFRLEDLIPVEPIVAIRYSINEQKRFKLVLESDVPLTIKKSITSQTDNVHDLVVMMEYQIQRVDAVQKEDTELVAVIEKQVEIEKGTVFKGDIIKTPVNTSSDAYAEKLFRQAYNDYHRGNISESLKKLNMSLNHDAGHIKARSTLALILSEKEHYELAYSVLNEGLIQYPNNVEWIKMYARLLLNQEKVIEAQELLEKQKPELITNTEYYALQAAVLQKLNGYEEAARIYRDLLHVNPLKGVWWMGLGISLESMRRYNDALYAYQKASNNSSLAKDSRQFISQRINRLNNILEDESS